MVKQCVRCPHVFINYSRKHTQLTNIIRYTFSERRAHCFSSVYPYNICSGSSPSQSAVCKFHITAFIPSRRRGSAGNAGHSSCTVAEDTKFHLNNNASLLKEERMNLTPFFAVCSYLNPPIFFVSSP